MKRLPLVRSLVLALSLVLVPVASQAQLAEVLRSPQQFCEFLLRGLQPRFPIFRVPGAGANVLILSSTFGGGHLSASRAAEASIRAADRHAYTKVVQVESLRWEIRNSIETRIFWGMVKNFPNQYDAIFRWLAKLESLDSALPHVSRNDLRRLIMEQNVSAVHVDHQPTAAVLATMIENGELPAIVQTKTFTQTDYYADARWLVKIAKNFDKTFVPHPLLVEELAALGVPREKLEAIVLPVSPLVDQKVDRGEFLRARGLDPEKLTITISTGLEAIGDYPLIVRSLAQRFKGRPLQLVAVTANNEAHYRALQPIKTTLKEEGIELLLPQGKLDSAELFGYFDSSDLIIGKTGGLTPTEIARKRKPNILIDAYGGHERTNAAFFEARGITVVNRDQARIGEQAELLLKDPLLIQRMRAAQEEFTNRPSTERVAEFILEREQSGAVR